MINNNANLKNHSKGFERERGEIGHSIKKMRELKNYTQSYMAEKLDMSNSGYSKIENNKTELTLNKIMAIAEILETDIASILNFDAKNIFYQTTSTNSIVKDDSSHKYFNANIEHVLTRLQNDIQALRIEITSKK